MSEKTVYAWHFTDDNMLRDGSPLPAVGETLKFYGEPILCQRGLHASLHPFDALKYAPGDTLHLVKCGGTMLYQDDKLVCTERTILASLEAEDMLRFFARMQALSVVDKAPELPNVVYDWLMTGDNTIRNAANSAAHYAYFYAASSAASSAANSAASSAANSAANSAARYAADSAAYYAASSAANSAANSAARQAFAKLVYECFEGPMYNVNFKGNK